MHFWEDMWLISTKLCGWYQHSFVVSSCRFTAQWTVVFDRQQKWNWTAVHSQLFLAVASSATRSVLDFRSQRRKKCKYGSSITVLPNISGISECASSRLSIWLYSIIRIGRNACLTSDKNHSTINRCHINSNHIFHSRPLLNTVFRTAP
jgi:hypothetical protein